MNNPISTPSQPGFKPNSLGAAAQLRHQVSTNQQLLNRSNQIVGTVRRVIFHQPQESRIGVKIRDEITQAEISVMGEYRTEPKIGQTIRAIGTRLNHPKYGPQIDRAVILPEIATNEAGLETYLAQHIAGVGKKTARAIIQAFGADMIRVAAEEPLRFGDVPRVGKIRGARIARALIDNIETNRVVLFLHDRGLSTAQALKLVRAYGARTIEVLTTDPYRLITDVSGFGFKSADKLAASIGITGNHPRRLEAGLTYTLDQAATQSGHTCLPLMDLANRAQKILGADQRPILEAVHRQLQAGRLSIGYAGDEVEVISDARWKRLEDRLGQELIRLRPGVAPWAGKTPQYPLPADDLSAHQRDALNTILGAKISVLRGGPGVGKTHTTKALIAFARAHGLTVKLSALSGKAASVAAEKSGHPGETMHRTLGVASPGSEDYDEIPTAFSGGKWRFKNNEKTKMEADVFIIDESSMPDIATLVDYLVAVPDHAAVILVGDPDQLKPVGPGQPFLDIINSGLFPVAELSELRRTSKDSEIVQAALAVRAGRCPNLRQAADSDFRYIPAADAETTAQTIERLVAEDLPAMGYDPVNDVQVLSPQKKGACGTIALNERLWGRLNGGDQPFLAVRGNHGFKLGDKVIQTANNYDIVAFNGEVGTVKEIDHEEKTLTVDLSNEPIIYDVGDAEDLDHAYALTVHKTQGSEYKVVILAVTREHAHNLRRSLLFTGITRGKSLVILVGDAGTIAQAARNNSDEKRWSRLGRLLRRAATRLADQEVPVIRP